MIPTRKQCLKILEQYELPNPVIKHSEFVTKVSVFIAEKAKRNGAEIDLEMLKAAAMLHDLDKIMIGKNAADHGKIACQILTKKGMSEVCSPILKHQLGNIGKPNLNPETWEEKIISYADKICTDKLVTLEERGLDWIKRYPASKNLVLSKLPLLATLEDEIFDLAKIDFESIKKVI